MAAQPSGSGHFLPIERDAFSSVTFGDEGPSNGGSGWRGEGSAFGAVTLQRSPRCPWGSGVHFLQPGDTGGAGPGRPSSPGSGGWSCLWTLGAFARSSERSVLAEAEVRVPVSVSCFSFFPPQSTFGSLSVFSFTFLQPLNIAKRNSSHGEINT